MNFVMSCNDNPTYFGFAKVVCEYYKKLGYKIHFAYLSDNENIDGLDCDSVLNLRPIPGYDSGVQAKLARSYLASTLPDDFYTLLDVDQILINIKFVESGVNKFMQLEEEADILAFGANAYQNTSEQGKWPMYFTTARPSGFRKLLGLNDESTFEDLLVTYSKIEDPIDSKEQTSNPFDRFSDESLFRYCSIRNDIKLANIDLPNFIQMRYAHRIDRSPNTMVSFGLPDFDMNFWNQTKLTDTQREMIAKGFFVDSFPARPYEQHQSLIDEIIAESIGFNMKIALESI